MSGRRSFICRECGARVSPGSFRARCPDCEGELGILDDTARRDDATRGEAD
ncbi:hypothetical protein [Halobellus ordinarius]|uniref:hypothetical protein n=1 Tax=Halobellus ordinarius TaxID=3075120 RepID=UPI0028804297|nr:hypothetical protein [Halobellus sp. ZY16]